MLQRTESLRPIYHQSVLFIRHKQWLHWKASNFRRVMGLGRFSFVGWTNGNGLDIQYRKMLYFVLHAVQMLQFKFHQRRKRRRKKKELQNHSENQSSVIEILTNETLEKRRYYMRSIIEVIFFFWLKMNWHFEVTGTKMITKRTDLFVTYLNLSWRTTSISTETSG